MSELQLVIDKDIAVITLYNPPANTWTEKSLQDLYHAVQALNVNPDVQCLILTGQGDRFFCAGADLKMFRGIDAREAERLAKCFSRAFNALASFSGLTIAALNGSAVGGGLEAALACDLRIAEGHAELGLPEARVGLLPCGGGTQRLPNLVGPAWAKRLILMGELIDVDSAREIGLVQQRVPKGAALAAAKEMAAQARMASPTSRRISKSLIDQSASILEAGLEAEASAFARLFTEGEATEGVLAFIEKRLPNWSN